MPWLPPTPCSQPGCPALSLDRYCTKHQLEHARQAASTGAGGGGRRRRYYNTRAWRVLRSQVLKRHKVCQCRVAGCHSTEPVQCRSLSTDVDHIVPRSKGGGGRRSNLQGMCHPCHSRKTATEDGGYGNAPGEVGLKRRRAGAGRVGQPPSAQTRRLDGARGIVPGKVLKTCD